MKILVIEDSERLRRALKEGLTRSGFVADLAGDGEEGLAFIETNEYDVVVLDILMPRMDGLKMLKRIRKAGNDVHVLILSARDQLEDRIEGLDSGADDYLVKPFSFDELVARIRSLGRRRHSGKSPQIRVGRVVLDTTRKDLFIDDRELRLTHAEYNVIEQLMRGRGRVLSKAQLLEGIHDSDTYATSNLVEVIISGLRKKLRNAGIEDLIQTRRGFGYFVDAGNGHRGENNV